MRSSATTCAPSSSACTGSSAPPRSTRLLTNWRRSASASASPSSSTGSITQVDTPERLYARPVDRHVAALIGDPPINLVKGTLKPGGNAGPTIELPFMELDGNHWREGLQALDAGTELLVGIRPHDLTLVDDGGDGVAATIEITEPQGDITILDLKAAGVPLRMVVAEATGARYAAGDSVRVALSGADTRLFLSDSGTMVA